MTTIVADSERVKKAIKWLAEIRLEKAGEAPKNESRLLNEASLKFDLTPQEAIFLEKFVAAD